jgi:hypothetical protein
VLFVFALAHTAWAQGETNFAMVGITRGQTLQLNLLAYPPSSSLPTAPCMAKLSFQDSDGNPLGPTKAVTLNTGESASLTLNGDTLLKDSGQRVEVLPKVATEGTVPAVSCRASVEVIDNVLGITTVGIPGAVAFTPNPVFAVVGVTPFQSVRLNAVANPPASCIGQLSFADKNGNLAGQMLDIKLVPGEATFLDLHGKELLPPWPIDGFPGTLFKGGGPVPRLLFHPIVKLASTSGADAASTACIVSVEVYDNYTIRTTVYFPPLPNRPGAQD